MEQPTKQERRELKRQEKFEEQRRRGKRKGIQKITKIFAVVFIVGGVLGAIFWYGATRPPTPKEETISRSGIHWHAELSIFIKGQKQQIPANIGLGVVHAPIHTHETDGVLHLEMTGFVTKEMTKLGKFFEIWDKQFNANCIFEFCNGQEGTVKMLVNGQENKEFENYHMKDKDEIEIRFE